MARQTADWLDCELFSAEDGRTNPRENSSPEKARTAVATTYKSTLEINVWKEHLCIGCGSRFRYLFKRKKTGQGRTPDAARAAAHKAVKTALAREVDMHPCP